MSNRFKIVGIISLLVAIVALSGCTSNSEQNMPNDAGTVNTTQSNTETVNTTQSETNTTKTLKCPYCGRTISLDHHTQVNDWGRCTCGAVVSLENPDTVVPCDKCGGKNLMFYRASENGKEYLKCLDCGWTIDDSQY
ncbi:hypothetical protein [Methanobacterium sp.]|uniref:hypothetical protein n=1 Tax=Methanobacterium sp. TaxID=2164 RepID=UPI0031589C2B